MYEESFGGGVSWSLHMLTDIAFRWIPGAVEVISGGVPYPEATRPILTPITEPVTTADVALFLQTSSASGAYDKLYHYWGVWVALVVMMTLLFMAAIIYCIVRILQVRGTELKRFEAAAHSVAAKDVSKTELRWNRVKEQISSDQEREWRLAILEADIMLNELLDVQGYRGETMGDKLKSVDRADFKTIDMAWEAHKVRNQVAHQGSMHDLNPREARRVISLYEQVFREFNFIK